MVSPQTYEPLYGLYGCLGREGEALDRLRACVNPVLEAVDDRDRGNVLGFPFFDHGLVDGAALVDLYRSQPLTLILRESGMSLITFFSRAIQRFSAFSRSSRSRSWACSLRTSAFHASMSKSLMASPFTTLPSLPG